MSGSVESRANLYNTGRVESASERSKFSSGKITEISGIPTVSLREFQERNGTLPHIPPLNELHRNFVQLRENEKQMGNYYLGELLPVDLDQALVVKIFDKLGRYNLDKNNPVDWYNPTQPVEDEGDRIMGVRLEQRHSEHSIVGFIKQNPRTGVYALDLTRPIFDMAQDPSITKDNEGNLLMSVISIAPDDSRGVKSYWTDQYIGSNVRNLKYFQSLPGKDNRPVQLKDGRIRGYYRPEIGGKGKIAVRDYESWREYFNDVKYRPLTEADLLITNFSEGNHGGPNYPLPDGQVYGHIAKKIPDGNGGVELFYCALWMLTDPKTGQILYEENEKGNLRPLTQIVAARDDLPIDPDLAPSKSKKTENVVFTAGAEPLENGRVRLTMGASDARIVTRDIKDPMLAVDWSRVRSVM